MTVRRLSNAIGVVVVALFVTACGGDKPTAATTAQTRVNQAEKAVADAQTELDKAKSQFCAETKDYVTTLDTYGMVIDQSAVTVGDVKAAGADLASPRAAVLASVDAIGTASDDLEEASQELADAQASLASVNSSSASAPPPTTTSTTLPAATLDRVKEAEAEWAAATGAISDQTPLAQAAAKVNAAAVALELAWLQVLNQAGCLTDTQQQQAAATIENYTSTLQAALAAAGFYSGAVDGVYGPATTQAVQDLQTASGLAPTGWVDRATALALDAALTAKGGAAATDALTTTTAVQTTLKLAGYWTGPIDGQWTPELTAALTNFQIALGVPGTGAIDAATIAALERAIADANSGSTSTISTPSPSTSSSSSSN